MLDLRYDELTNTYTSNQNYDCILGKSMEQDQKDAILLLQNKILASTDLALKDKSCCSDINFLTSFLYAKKFNYKDAFELLIKYLTFQCENYMWLRGLSIFDDKIGIALRDGNPRVLNQRDRKGRKIITFIASNWDPTKYNLIDIHRAFLITIDKLLDNIQNQALGFIVVVDWTNFTFTQSVHLKPSVLKLMVQSLQESIPANFKGIHFICQPWYIDIASTLIKGLLTEKMKTRFIVHGKNFSSLHNCINKNVLPPDLGGEGPIISTLDWYHYLIESSQITKDLKPYRLVQESVYTTFPNIKVKS